MYMLVAKDAKFLHVDTCNEASDQTANACWVHISKYNVCFRVAAHIFSSVRLPYALIRSCILMTQ